MVVSDLLYIILIVCKNLRFTNLKFLLKFCYFYWQTECDRYCNNHHHYPWIIIIIIIKQQAVFPTSHLSGPSNPLSPHVPPSRRIVFDRNDWYSVFTHVASTLQFAIHCFLQISPYICNPYKISPCKLQLLFQISSLPIVCCIYLSYFVKQDSLPYSNIGQIFFVLLTFNFVSRLVLFFIFYWHFRICVEIYWIC